MIKAPDVTLLYVIFAFFGVLRDPEAIPLRSALRDPGERRVRGERARAQLHAESLEAMEGRSREAEARLSLAARGRLEGTASRCGRRAERIWRSSSPRREAAPTSRSSARRAEIGEEAAPIAPRSFPERARSSPERSPKRSSDESSPREVFLDGLSGRARLSPHRRQVSHCPSWPSSPRPRRASMPPRRSSGSRSGSGSSLNLVLFLGVLLYFVARPLAAAFRASGSSRSRSALREAREAARRRGAPGGGDPRSDDAAGPEIAEIRARGVAEGETREARRSSSGPIEEAERVRREARGGDRDGAWTPPRTSCDAPPADLTSASARDLVASQITEDDRRRLLEESVGKMGEAREPFRAPLRAGISFERASELRRGRGFWRGPRPSCARSRGTPG